METDKSQETGRKLFDIDGKIDLETNMETKRLVENHPKVVQNKGKVDPETNMLVGSRSKVVQISSKVYNIPNLMGEIV